MRTIETSNGALAVITAGIAELILWADADAKHAKEHAAFGTARNDQHRAALLRQALNLLKGCEQ